MEEPLGVELVPCLRAARDQRPLCPPLRAPGASAGACNRQRRVPGDAPSCRSRWMGRTWSGWRPRCRRSTRRGCGCARRLSRAACAAPRRRRGCAPAPAAAGNERYDQQHRQQRHKQQRLQRLAPPAGRGRPHHRRMRSRPGARRGPGGGARVCVVPDARAASVRRFGAASRLSREFPPPDAAAGGGAAAGRAVGAAAGAARRALRRGRVAAAVGVDGRRRWRARALAAARGRRRHAGGLHAGPRRRRGGAGQRQRRARRRARQDGARFVDRRRNAAGLSRVLRR